MILLINLVNVCIYVPHYVNWIKVYRQCRCSLHVLIGDFIIDFLKDTLLEIEYFYCHSVMLCCKYTYVAPFNIGATC